MEEGEYGYDTKISYSDIVNYDFYFNQEIEYAQIKSNTLEIWDGSIDGYFSWYTGNN